MEALSKTQMIRTLNDVFRQTFIGGTVLVTAGVDNLPDRLKHRVIQAVHSHKEFSAGNDPNGEHDFGSFAIEQRKFFWKIDYYDRAMKGGSEDPSDPARTTRVLTVMCAEEY